VGLMVLVPIVGLAGLLFLQSPSNDRNWVQNHAVLPTVEYAGDILTVGNVRDFRYDETGAIIEPRYEDRRYDISQLTEVWYGISHFSKFDGLAHSFLSFGFADGQYLALSIEARRTVGQPYDPLRGLFVAKVHSESVVVECEPDPDLRDTEQVPLLEEGGIEAFLRREVLPYTRDAWYLGDKVKTGYEVSFTRYFYKPKPLRTLEEIRADIRKDLARELELTPSSSVTIALPCSSLRLYARRGGSA